MWFEEFVPIDTKCDIQLTSELGTPLAYYRLFVDEEVFNNITEQTTLYSVQKSGTCINTKSQEILQLLVIHMMMSVVKMLSYIMFLAEETRYPQVAGVMSHNRFKVLRSF